MEEVLGLHWEKSFDCNVQLFHEKARREESIELQVGEAGPAEREGGG